MKSCAEIRWSLSTKSENALALKTPRLSKPENHGTGFVG
jgi:hypothetical protein